MKKNEYIGGKLELDLISNDREIETHDLIKFLQKAVKLGATKVELSSGYDGDDITLEPLFKREETPEETKKRENEHKKMRGMYKKCNLISAVEFMDSRVMDINIISF